MLGARPAAPKRARRASPRIRAAPRGARARRRPAKGPAALPLRAYVIIRAARGRGRPPEASGRRPRAPPWAPRARQRPCWPARRVRSGVPRLHTRCAETRRQRCRRDIGWSVSARGTLRAGSGRKRTGRVVSWTTSNVVGTPPRPSLPTAPPRNAASSGAAAAGADAPTRRARAVETPTTQDAFRYQT